MARGVLLILCLFTAVFSGLAESCLPSSIRATVPQRLTTGHVISTVDLGPCGGRIRQMKSSDPDFSVRRDGTILSQRLTTVPLQGKSFSIRIQDQEGRWSRADVSLSHHSPGQTRIPQSAGHRGEVRRRSKRRWSPLPFEIMENEAPPFPKQIGQVASDSSVNHSLYYTISGPGITQHPLSLFSLDTNTGMLSVHRPIDREEFPQIQFLVRAFDKFTHQETDRPLPITVIVKDENDNAPTFTQPLHFSVPEQCRSGTVVGKVNATDKDEPQTLHTKIKFSLLSGMELFHLQPQTGVITVRTGSLDREIRDTHEIIVEIRDMNGAHNGLWNTATATVRLLDINDNPPAFTQTFVSAKVEENRAHGLILSLPVEDRDLPRSPGWNAKYTITKGNENKGFSIETDPKTNAGLLYITKPLDYEKTKVVQLEVLAQNEVELVGTTSQWISIPVNVAVQDADEGPEFSPPDLHLRIKEGIPMKSLIGTYTATDPETRSSSGIRYYKVLDPAGWVSIGETTGELRTKSAVDRESSFVRDGFYNVTIKAVDSSYKSGTGTVIMHIEDINDHAPQIQQKDLTLCENDVELGFVLLRAEDQDQNPFSAPFTFQLLEDYDGRWTITNSNGTAAVLQQRQLLPTGLHQVPVMVQDQQGLGREQEVTVRICHCLHGRCPPPRPSASLGLWAMLIMLLALVSFLLLGFCLALVCGTKKKKVFVDSDSDSSGMILKSNTEGPGEEVSSSVVLVPASAIDHTLKALAERKRAGAVSPRVLRGAKQDTKQSLQQQWEVQGDAFGRAGGGDESHFRNSDFSLYAIWETNGMYLDKKLNYFVTEDRDRFADDILHSYTYEGRDSPGGSVACCSELGADEGLDFLDTLGPQFRALAEACGTK